MYFRIFFTFSNIAMNAAAPEGAPPRWISDWKHFGKYCFVEIICPLLSGTWESDPLSPPKGEAAQGGTPP